MKTKSIIIFCSLFVVVFFQNCSQPGELNLISDPELQKSAAAEPGPLVIDVVDAVNDIKKENSEQEQVAEQEQPKEQEQVAEQEQPKEEEQVKEQEQVAEQEQPKEQEQVAEQEETVNNVEEVLADNSCGPRGDKVLVCHFPPGNPSAKHTICISRKALEAHQNHGHSEEQHQDYVGACVN